MWDFKWHQISKNKSRPLFFINIMSGSQGHQNNGAKLIDFASPSAVFKLRGSKLDHFYL